MLRFPISTSALLTGFITVVLAPLHAADLPDPASVRPMQVLTVPSDCEPATAKESSSIKWRFQTIGSHV